MSLKSLETYRRRYARAGRDWKTRILDEICEMEGWTRKHIIKVMRGKVRRHAKPRCGRQAIYGSAEARMLEKLWLLMDQPCGKLMRAGLPEWLDSWERHHGDCLPELHGRLLRISAAQIDRLLAPAKLRHPRKWRAGGGRVHLRNQIPVRVGPWATDTPPGSTLLGIPAMQVLAPVSFLLPHRYADITTDAVQLIKLIDEKFVGYPWPKPDWEMWRAAGVDHVVTFSPDYLRQNRPGLPYDRIPLELVFSNPSYRVYAYPKDGGVGGGKPCDG